MGGHVVGKSKEKQNLNPNTDIVTQPQGCAVITHLGIPLVKF